MQQNLLFVMTKRILLHAVITIIISINIMHFYLYYELTEKSWSG